MRHPKDEAVQGTTKWQTGIPIPIPARPCSFHTKSYITFIKPKIMNKETYRFMYPADVASFSFMFSDRALQWLCGTTTDDDGRETVNFILFGDLLARMALTAGESKGFRRPLTLSAGQAQYSEEQLSTQWNMGRKRIRNLLDALTDMGLIETHRSRVASVMTFPCIRGWETFDGGCITNPFFHEQREE